MQVYKYQQAARNVFSFRGTENNETVVTKSAYRKINKTTTVSSH